MIHVTVDNKSLEVYLQDMYSKIMEIDAKLSKLEFKMISEAPEIEPEEAPKTEYEQLKEEILEEVNLIVSDLMAGV
jgi:hypothetical protein